MFLLLENVVHTYLCIKRHKSCKGYKWRLKCKYDKYQITNFAIFFFPFTISISENSTERS